MTLRTVVLLSVAALSCAGSIQNPHIHDSIVDQIAMESGPTRSVVAAPAHFLKTVTKPPSDEPTTPEVHAAEQGRPTTTTTKKPPSTLFEILSSSDKDEDSEGAGPFLHPATPVRPSAPVRTPAPLRPSAQVRPSAPQRPSVPLRQQPERRPQPQFIRRPPFPSYGGRPSGSTGGWGQSQSGVQVLQLPSRYGYGGLNLGNTLGGFGGARTVILLQPIYMPVPVRAAADDDQALSADSSQSERDEYFRDQVARRPVSLLDILQQPFYF